MSFGPQGEKCKHFSGKIQTLWMDFAKLGQIKAGRPTQSKGKSHIKKIRSMKKEILFSDEQYKALVKLIFYGEWMLNANKLDEEHMDKEAMQIQDYIFSQNDRFSLSDWMLETNQGIELNEDKTLELLDEIFEYNEDTFWPHLVNKLAERDTIEEINQSDEYLSESEQEEILFKNEEKYEEAFYKNGLQGLRLIE